MAARAPVVEEEAGPDRGQQIIDAAYELLAESGLEGLTIRAVLARTGLARRAFYERFAGKDDLVLAVFDQTLRYAAEYFGELVAPIPDPVERLRLIVTSIVIGIGMAGIEAVDNDRRSAALSREHLRLAEARPADLEAALRPLIALIEKQLVDGMAAGQVRKAAPERLATLVYNVVATTTHAELLAQESAQLDRERREQLASDIWEFCRRAIAA